MTMLKIITGVDEKGNPTSHAYVHPFLAGARRREQRVPSEFETRKTKVMRNGFRVIPREAFVPVREKTSKKEIARNANR